MLAALSASGVIDAVAIEQPHGLVQPLPTPPVPTEALSFTGSPQMAPRLLFYPVFNEAKAPARVSDRKVANPAAQHRVDEFPHQIQRLRLKAPEGLLELAQQRRALLQLRRVLRSPYPSSREDTAKIEPQKAKAFAPTEVYDSTFLFIHFYVELGKLFPYPLHHRREPPA